MITEPMGADELTIESIEKEEDQGESCRGYLFVEDHGLRGRRRTGTGQCHESPEKRVHRWLRGSEAQ